MIDLTSLKTLLEYSSTWNLLPKEMSMAGMIELYKSRYKFLTSGNQASVFLTKPGVVVKIIHLYGKNDSLVHLYKNWIRNKDNFLIPRIFELKFYTSQNSRDEHPYWVVVEMEQLHSLRQLPNHASATSLRIDAEFLIAMWRNSGVEVSETTKLATYGELIIEINPAITEFVELGKKFYTGKFTKANYRVSNDNFPRYGKFARSIAAKTGASWDFNEDYMIRLTRYGPQLVLIDPMIS